jgi:hypothetical protein
MRHDDMNAEIARLRDQLNALRTELEQGRKPDQALAAPTPIEPPRAPENGEESAG